VAEPTDKQPDTWASTTDADQPEKTVARVRRQVVVMLCLATVPLILLTLAGFASGVWWRFDLACHFRAQYAWSLGLITCGFLVFRRWRPAAVAAVFAFANAACPASFWFRSDTCSDGGRYQHLRIMLSNVNTANRSYRKLEQHVIAEDPDVLVLMEVDRHWLTGLSQLRQIYPHRIEEPRSDNFGIALFSRCPVAASERVQLGAATVPSILATLNVRGTEFDLLATHPLPPVSAENTRFRDEQLRAAAACIRDAVDPRILIGDLNVTPYSNRFRQLVYDSGLHDSMRGSGVQTTWPRSLPFMRIPIDHCLCSVDVLVLGRRVGPEIGSDHFPVTLDLGIPVDQSDRFH